MNWTFFLYLLIGLGGLQAQPTDTFTKLTQDFTREYNALNIAGLTLSYVDNLNNIATPEELEAQWQFFEQQQQVLSAVEKAVRSKDVWQSLRCRTLYLGAGTRLLR